MKKIQINKIYLKNKDEDEERQKQNREKRSQSSVNRNFSRLGRERRPREFRAACGMSN